MLLSWFVLKYQQFHLSLFLDSHYKCLTLSIKGRASRDGSVSLRHLMTCMSLLGPTWYKREPNHAECPLTSIGVLWYAHTHTHPKINIKINYHFLMILMCVGILSVYVSCLWGCQTPGCLSWQLWDAIWVLVIEPGSSRRADITLNCWATSGPRYILFFFFSKANDLVLLWKDWPSKWSFKAVGDSSIRKSALPSLMTWIPCLESTEEGDSQFISFLMATLTL